MTLEQLTAERDQLRAQVGRLREALKGLVGRFVLLAAHGRAPVLGQLELAIAVDALASTPDAEGGVAPKAKEGA